MNTSHLGKESWMHRTIAYIFKNFSMGKSEKSKFQGTQTWEASTCFVSVQKPENILRLNIKNKNKNQLCDFYRG